MNAPTHQPDSAGATRAQTTPEPANASTGELIGQLTEQLSRLVRDEARLAQAEVTQKAKKLGVGAGLFGGAGLMAFFGTAVLIAAVVLGLAVVLPAWLAALIVAVVVAIAAGIAALVGKKKVAEAGPPVPIDTAESVKKDVEGIKESARR
jgi:hypothetical protein